MITENGITYYTYEETAIKLRTRKQYVYDLVSLGKLTSYKIGHGRKKYIMEKDVLEHLNLPTSSIQPSHAVPIPFSTESTSFKLIQEVSNAYKDIAARYERTVTPLIKTANDTDIEAFTKALTNAMQSVYNRLYSLPLDKSLKQYTEQEFIQVLLQDIDLPEYMRQRIISDVINSIDTSLSNNLIAT